MVMKILHQNQNWLSPSRRSQLLRKNIGGPPISARWQIWSSLLSFTSFASENMRHLPPHGRNGPSRCETAIFVCGTVQGTSFHTQQGWRHYYRQIALQYALRTQRMELKERWCTTVVVGDQSALLQRLLEELRTYKLGPPEEISISCTTQVGASPGCQIATLGLRFNGVQHVTTSHRKATLSTASHHIASEPGERWQ
jgi:hypothetical protein